MYIHRPEADTSMYPNCKLDLDSASLVLEAIGVHL